MKGQFIVFYGINNLGKTTQAKLLVEKLHLQGKQAEYLKYPVYNLAPSGPMLNDYLRNDNPYSLSAREAQLIYTMNRTQFETTLKNKLEKGINIISEDYVGTGLAWGIGADVDEHFLKQINSHLLSEDVTFLFDGERFLDSTEQNHKHETDNELMKKVREAHLRLGQEFNWKKINANLPIEEIHRQILQCIEK